MLLSVAIETIFLFVCLLAFRACTDIVHDESVRRDYPQFLELTYKTSATPANTHYVKLILICLKHNSIFWLKLHIVIIIIIIKNKIKIIIVIIIIIIIIICALSLSLLL